jgi:hypothetical protein
MAAPIYAYPFAILMLFVSVTVSDTLRNIFSISSTYVDELAFSIFGVYAGFTWLISRKTFSRDPAFFWLIGIAAYALGVSLAQDVSTAAMLLGLLLVLKPIIIYLLFSQVPLRPYLDTSSLPGAIRCYFTIFLVTTILYALLVELGGYNPIPGTSPPPRFGNIPVIRAYFIHPGPFSSVAVLAFFWFFSELLLTKKWSSFFGTIAAVICILSTQRVKSFVFMLVSIVVVCLIVRYLRRRITLAGFMLIIVLLASSAAFGWIVLKLIFPAEADTYFGLHSQAVRTRLLIASLQIASDTYGFGAGLGRFGSSVSLADFSDLYGKYGITQLWGGREEAGFFITDQWWAWYLGEIGIWGTMMFLFFIGTTILRAFANRYVMAQLGDDFVVLSITGICGLLYGTCTGFADGNLTTPPTGYLVMSMTGLIFACLRAHAASVR